MTYWPSSFAWSPDGKLIAYTTDSLHVVGADGSSPRRLTGTFAAQPAFSPDSSRIAFASYTPDAGYELFDARVDGSGLTRLTTNDAIEQAPAWSPDGTRIAYARMSQSDLDGQVATVSPLGGPEQVALREPAQTAIDAGPWWSPDGSRLLVADHLASNDRELYLTFGSRSRVRQLTSNGVDDSDPAVSPDGRFLAFDRGNVGDEEVYVGGSPAAGSGV